MKKTILKAGLISSVVLSVLSCGRDYLDTDTQSAITAEQLATSPDALAGLMEGIYTAFQSYGQTSSAGHEDFGHKAVLSGLDLMSNDMVQTKHHWFGFYYNYQAVLSTSTRATMLWKTYYQQVKAANAIIQAVEEGGITDKNKGIYGQALAMRGYSFFMLVRTFAPTYYGNQDKPGIPLYTKATLDGAAKSTIGETYTQILSDLEKAETNLTGVAARTNKSKIDLSVARAFLAQVHLEMRSWDKAATYAKLARAGYSQPTEQQWLDGFYDLDAVPDAMWGGYITAATTSFVASFFSHFQNNGVGGYASGLEVYKSIDKRLYDAIESTDYRKKAFLDAPVGKVPKYANVKFMDKSDGNGGDYIYMRASEMYYVEAEALARQNKDGEARQVLNEITKLRNPSYNYTGSGDALIKEVLLQKRIELWGEGVAFLDMKRLGEPLQRDYAGSNHVVMQGRLNIPAGDSRFIFKVPESEILANPNIKNDY